MLKNLKSHVFFQLCSDGSRGRVRGVRTPLSDLTLTTLRLKFLHRQDRISLFNWLIFLMKRAWQFSTMICSPLLAKQYFPRQRRPVFTDWETRGRLCFLSWSKIMATTRLITTFFQPVKSSEIENETVNGEEAEAEAMEFENSKLFYAFIPFPEKC